MRTIIQIAILIFPMILGAQDDCDLYKDKNFHPSDHEEAVYFFDCNWSNSDKDRFRQQEEELAVSRMHSVLGNSIKTDWLERRDEKELVNFFHGYGVHNPDDMSCIILNCFYRYLNDENFDLQELVDFYIEKEHIKRYRRN